MLKKVKLNKAIGLAIGHDMTKVVPGKFKGPAFRRGHIIREEDLPELRLMGKEHIYIHRRGRGIGARRGSRPADSQSRIQP